jgi:hypothetical protein
MKLLGYKRHTEFASDFRGLRTGNVSGAGRGGATGFTAFPSSPTQPQVGRSGEAPGGHPADGVQDQG